MTTEPTPLPDPVPEPSADRDAAPSTARTGVPWATVAAVLVLAVLVFAAAVTFPYWRGHLGLAPRAAGPAQDIEELRGELAATRDRLRQVEARVAQLSERPGAAEGGGDALAGRVASLEQALRALQGQPQVPARLADEVDNLARQVAELKKTAADAGTVLRLADRVEQSEALVRELQAQRSTAAALLLAVGQLRDAVSLGLPFDAELRSLKALAPQDEEVARAAAAVQDHAATGIPTRLMLAERFEALAPQIVRAEMLPAADSWWRGSLNRLLSLITVRREDGATNGDDAAAVVARAQGRLGQGDLAGAARELGRLSGTSAEVAGPWMADARARVGADRALSELTAHGIALTGAKVSP
jgi:hypothetical protein